MIVQDPQKPHCQMLCQILHMIETEPQGKLVMIHLTNLISSLDVLKPPIHCAAELQFTQFELKQNEHSTAHTPSVSSCPGAAGRHTISTSTSTFTITTTTLPLRDPLSAEEKPQVSERTIRPVRRTRKM